MMVALIIIALIIAMLGAIITLTWPIAAEVWEEWRWCRAIASGQVEEPD